MCIEENAHEHTGSAEASGFPCAVVYGLLRALPGERAFLPPSSLRSLLLTNLTPASGRQDHTTSPSATTAFVARRHRVHRIPPRVRDDRDPPLSSGETGRADSADLPDMLSGIFYARGLDRLVGDLPVGQISASSFRAPCRASSSRGSTGVRVH
jgi:hypothetical protein